VSYMKIVPFTTIVPRAQDTCAVPVRTVVGIKQSRSVVLASVAPYAAEPSRANVVWCGQVPGRWHKGTSPEGVSRVARESNRGGSAGVRGSYGVSVPVQGQCPMAQESESERQKIA